MFEAFSTMFSTIFIAFGIAAVIGHALLIDALLGRKPPEPNVASNPQPTR